MAFKRKIAELSAELVRRPDDLVLLQKLAELLQKDGELVDAAEAFRLVAEKYARDGMFLKSIALLKQVLRLDPARGDVNLRLGELHRLSGLHEEAEVYLRLAIAHFRRTRDTKSEAWASELLSTPAS